VFIFANHKIGGVSMKIYTLPFIIIGLFSIQSLLAQQGYWQQRVKYVMNVRLDTAKHQVTGTQKITYTNNSGDTLKVLYFLMYWNAFQPNSMMDVRSRELGKIVLPNGRQDWDGRVRDRIAKLAPDEIGIQKLDFVKINGIAQTTELYETILKVILSKPILPKTTVEIETGFFAQVPVQIRRSGRNNAEGVAYSMSQWYPKLCEYDAEGWHPTPYIAREFYGVWGDFEVNITLPKSYCIAGTGYLQNPNEIGFGYQGKGVQVKSTPGNFNTWKFIAPNVHDFVWAADRDYIHTSKQIRNDLTLHAFYKIDEAKLTAQFNAMNERQKKQHNNDVNTFIRNYTLEWEMVLDLAEAALPFIESKYGVYPYKQYSFIQGGDGGMEYPMATLLKGAGQGVVIHEWMHSWYQHLLGTNESLHGWMDEGFTSYAEEEVVNFLAEEKVSNPHKGGIDAYVALAKSPYDEPLTTHADQYNTNYAYSTNSYTKGETFLIQLQYIIGKQAFDKTMLDYYNLWKFKHPNPEDFIRVAENASNLQLDWYRTFFVNTTKTIDYKIDSVWQQGSKSYLRVKRNGAMPMPIDVLVTLTDGTKQLHTAPLNVMYGNKPQEDAAIKQIVQKPYYWTHTTYTFEFDFEITTLKSIEIDPEYRLADVNRKDNSVNFDWGK
jgi:hypothetical protein